MTNLKNDLDEYLLLQSDQKKSFKIDMKMPTIKVPEIKSFFGRNEPQETNSWLQETQESCFPKLSRVQRIIGFITCIGLGIFCMTVSTFYIPVLILKARKFSLLFSLGSLFFILSFCFLSGFMAFFKQAFSRSRLTVSLCYASSLLATMYFAMFAQSTAFTVLFAVAQIITLLLMIMAEIPGGTSGLKFFGSMFKSKVSSTLPI
ncbi:hypothetical protein HA402_012938 [Bradysia odoriphaga]|nr:hypothetical protein HA402_012938 [Bradysia odoriphaga]